MRVTAENTDGSEASNKQVSGSTAELLEKSDVRIFVGEDRGDVGMRLAGPGSADWGIGIVLVLSGH
jgi:hypothetical protein